MCVMEDESIQKRKLKKLKQIFYFQYFLYVLHICLSRIVSCAYELVNANLEPRFPTP